MRTKLSYEELEGLTEELFKKVSSEFKPEVIIHPGVRTDYLVTRAESYFGMKPIILDTTRPFPLKKLMRFLFYDVFDLIPDSIADYIVDRYIKIVHSDSKRPKLIREDALECVPAEASNALIIDDVFCTGQTSNAVTHALTNRGISNVKAAVLIYTPVNDLRPDFYALEGKYSLPWRNVGV